MLALVVVLFIFIVGLGVWGMPDWWANRDE